MFFTHRLSRWAGLFVAGAFLWGYGPSSASAQSMFGTGGAASQTGGSAFGGAASAAGRRGVTNSTPGFSSSFAGSNLGGQTGMGGRTGMGGQTGLGTQPGGITGTQMPTELGQLSATAGQGFIGRGDNMGRFVGNQVAGQQGIQGTTGGTGRLGGQVGRTGGQVGGRGTTGRTTMGGQTGFNQTGFNRQGGAQGQGRRQIRPRQRIAFDFPARETTQVQANLDSQFTRLRTSRPGLGGVQLRLGDNQEVVLRGTVASEADSKLAAMLARMEPGVRTVRNELAVESE